VTGELSQPLQITLKQKPVGVQKQRISHTHTKKKELYKFS